MRTTCARVSLGVALVLAFAPACALARPPAVEEATSVVRVDGERSTASTVWFQGFLADDTTGDPINATYNIVARIYSAAGGGTLLWGPETHSSVAITEGWFNIELGSVVSPLPSFASPPYYLSLQVNGEYLAPRLKLASVPSALQSSTSDLLPFDGTYAGSSAALRIDNSGAGYALVAHQSSTTATGTGVATFDIDGTQNNGGVVRSETNGGGYAYYGWSCGPWPMWISGNGTDQPDVDVHLIHAAYAGGDRAGDNIAVYGEALDDSWGIGGEFHGSGHGVVGIAEAPASGPLIYRGVVGLATSTTTGQNVGVWGEASGGADNYAGVFYGDVDVAGTLSKDAGSFKMDHPLDPANKYLYHSFVESPDMMNVYNGNAVLDAAGEVWVELPDWFEALNRDFRYQLTPVGSPAPGLYVADEIAGNRFRIAGGEPGTKVSWLVTGIRHDPYADAHRIPVEEDKPSSERGRYRNPELYGQPETAGVLYEARAAFRGKEGL